MMDLASNNQERLVNGFALMATHADDPKWELQITGNQFLLKRHWHYPNTLPRAEAFAAISELREWLIVMQRGIREPIWPLGLRLSASLLKFSYVFPWPLLKKTCPELVEGSRPISSWCSVYHEVRTFFQRKMAENL